jgi:serine/threonine-protein kinase
MPSAPLPPGACIEGRYVVGEVIGSGGAGVVVAAHHLALDAPVAVKFLKPSALSNDARKRFLREARLAHRLKSAHALQIHDVGELASGELYLVMERLVGHTLDREIAARGPLPEHEAAELLAQACEAMAEAHALGIVHRDLKPQNLFIHEGPLGRVVKVVDFGLSKEIERTSPHADGANGPAHTRTFMFMGTPRYMPPEQWEPGAIADPRMDVYALGVVLHELLTGKVPFEHVPLKERAPLILGASTPDPRAIRPSISQRMAEIVMNCLKPRAEDRTPSARHLERLLLALGTSSASSGAATLMLSRVVETKTKPGLERSPHAARGSDPPARGSPQRSAPPPGLKPTFALPMSLDARSALQPQAAPAAIDADAAHDEGDGREDGGVPRAVLALTFILFLLAIASGVALLRAAGRI